jgi:hypothetical protein
MDFHFYPYGYINPCGTKYSSPQIVKKTKTKVRIKNGQQKVLLLHAFCHSSPCADGQFSDAVGAASQFRSAPQEA